MRKLVTVRTVSEIEPIKNADRIEIAHIDGWQCVVKKGEFSVGDKGLYFEIDSFLPGSDPRFKFLEPRFTTWHNKVGARIKTMRLKGELSQGLLLPLKDFPEIKPSTFNWEKDYAEELGVMKWEREDSGNSAPRIKPTWLGKLFRKYYHTRLRPVFDWFGRTFPSLVAVRASQNFPSFIRKTDQERVQNLINKQSFRDDAEYEVTIKLDGSSMTCYYNRGKTGVCSRNLDLKKDTENKFWATALETKVVDALKKLKKNLATQGELIGPGIQGNRENLTQLEYHIFDIWSIDEQRYLTLAEREDILHLLTEFGYNGHYAEDLEVTKLDRFKTIDDFLVYAEGPSYKAPTREGVVFKRVDGKSSFKVISNSYLEKHGD